MAEEEEKDINGSAWIGSDESEEATNFDSGRKRVEGGSPFSSDGELHLAFEVAS